MSDIIHILLDDILNYIHDGILVTDIDFNIIYKNMYTEKLFMDLYEQLISDKININLIELIPQLKIIIDNTKIFKNRKIEINISSNRNAEKILEFTFNTLNTNDKLYHLIMIHTIVQKKDDGGHKHLIAYFSHELRNPLQSITLAIHLLKSGIKLIEETNENIIPTRTLSYIDTINKSCYDMKRIINDILDLSKIEENEFIIDIEICDMNEIIDNIIDENNNEAQLKKITIIKNINQNVPKSLYTDSTRISQILNNLITNAIKYSDKGTIILDVNRIINNKIDGICFSVIDEGIGIRQEEICNLFKPYGTTSNSNPTSPKVQNLPKIDSTGLGLCVSQKIAKLLGGHITVKSEHKKGSVFSLYHPITLELSDNKYYIDDYLEILEGNILLVDDNQSNLSLFQILLENFNYEYKWKIKIESVNNGKDAIDLCKINKYDLIFMDINMTGIDGCTTSKIIKTNGYTNPIVATTGNILSYSENNNNEFTKYFNDIIIKPFDNIIIQRSLKKWLSK